MLMTYCAAKVKKFDDEHGDFGDNNYNYNNMHID